MPDVQTERCGYTWPENFEVGNSSPSHQFCCFRECLADNDRCAWHADPEKTEQKDASTLRAATASAQIKEATQPGELLIKANLSDTNLSDKISLSGTQLRCANFSGVRFSCGDLSDTYLKKSKFSGSYLRNADLSNAYCYRADFSDANLRGADGSGAVFKKACLNDTRMKGIDLSQAEIKNANIVNSYIEEAKFVGCKLKDSDLSNAIFPRANLTRANLSGANLRGAEFYGAITTDAQINEDTQFGDHYTDENGNYCPEDYQKARWCNRTIEQLAEDNAFPQTAREAYLRRKRLQRCEARHEGNTLSWLRLVVEGSITGYGESYRRVVATALSVIAVATVLYPLKLVQPADPGGGPLTYPAVTYPLDTRYVGELLTTLGDSLYFSVLTFTTLGYGDFEPVGLGRALATFEAGAGVTLFALLVFVLGRRATR